MSLVVTILSAIIIFSVIIFVHELGHFLTAKWFGVYVEEFALGMGPALFKKKKGETIYSLRAIPMGGFCKMMGEDDEVEDPRSFSNLPKFKRFIVLFAGAFMNLVLGFVIMITLVSVFIPSSGFASLNIKAVNEALPAYESGIRQGDKIEKVNGKRVRINEQYQNYAARSSEGMELQIRRGNEKLTFYVEPKEYKIKEGELLDPSNPIEAPTKRMIGITFDVKPKNVGTVIYEAFYKSVLLGELVITSLGDLITGAIAPSNLAGPIGIVNEISTAAKMGVDYILFLAALITINLGLFNLLPFPALDGGRILFILIEAVTRKRVPPKYEGIFHIVGFLLLILLMIYATGNDIMRIFFK